MPYTVPFPAQEHAEKLARSLGCDVFEVSFANEPPRPAVKGGCFQFATLFKAFGGHWNHSRKVHVFASWDLLAASLKAAAERQAAEAGAASEDVSDAMALAHEAGAPSRLPPLSELAQRANATCQDARAGVAASVFLRRNMRPGRFSDPAI